MQNRDSINLLKQCDAGSKTAISTIEKLMTNVKNHEFRKILSDSKSCHKQLNWEICQLLNQYDNSTHEPELMATGISWLQMIPKFSHSNCDSITADILTDSCNAGIKSLRKFRNEYSAANQNTQNLCKRLIVVQSELCENISQFLKA